MKLSDVSLKWKLIFATTVVQVAMASLLALNSARLIESSLIEQAELRHKELTALLNASLGGPLVEGDYGTILDLLDQARNRDGIVYMVLYDRSNAVIARSGHSGPLPIVDSSMLEDDGDNIYDTQVPIDVNGHVYGVLRYGLSTRFLAESRAHLIRQSMLIGGVALVLSIALLAGVAFLLTRHLGTLIRVSRQVASGNLWAVVPVNTKDEVGVLAEAFNKMTVALRERIDALSKSEADFHAIADYTYSWENWHSPEGKLIWVNSSVERVAGYTPQECLAMEAFPMPVIYSEDAEKARQEFERALRGGSGSDFELRIVRKTGELIWCSFSWQSIYDAKHTYLGVRSSISDISERKSMDALIHDKIEELQHSEEVQRELVEQAQLEQARLLSLLSAMNIGILFASMENRIVYTNPAFTRIWMLRDVDNLVGRPISDVLKFSSNVLAQPDNFSKYLMQVVGTHEISDTVEISMADGRLVTQVSYPVRARDGAAIGRMWIYEDITHERQTAEQLIYLAERDSLTGLYNRHRFQEELARMISEAKRRDGSGALIFFDLDEFKYINDTFGHRAGDAMLIRVAGEVGTLVRRNEFFSRLGGDEFALLVPDGSEIEAVALAERIVRAISQIPFRFEGQNLRLTASLGIALYPLHATNVEELITHADTAMYQAKEAGKNAWRVYRQDLDATREMVNRMTWNDRISQALEMNLLRLHFQGIYETDSGRLSHLEALVRMIDETDATRLIMPGHFIPFAERSGKIIDIDRWVIREAVRLLAESPHVDCIAINISGRSFDEPSLPQFIAEQLEARSVRPSRLQVELTETSAVSDLHDAQRFIEGLHQAGCTVCLDDFGAGFSSFAYLKHIKADTLKIDGLFIRDLPNDHDNQLFVKAIVDVARGLHKTTVAEFVEDQETLEMLKGFGVDKVQGYFLDTPRADHPALLPPPTDSAAAL